VLGDPVNLVDPSGLILPAAVIVAIPYVAPVALSAARWAALQAARWAARQAAIWAAEKAREQTSNEEERAEKEAEKGGSCEKSEDNFYKPTDDDPNKYKTEQGSSRQTQAAERQGVDAENRTTGYKGSDTARGRGRGTLDDILGYLGDLLGG